MKRSFFLFVLSLFFDSGANPFIAPKPVPTHSFHNGFSDKLPLALFGENQLHGWMTFCDGEAGQGWILLAAATAAIGQADNLVVYKPNRLDRSEWGLNTLLLMQELKTLGVNLHYSQDNRRVDLANPMEVFMYGSFAGWQAGEDYSETVRKLREGRIARAKSGFVVPHGISPFGYAKIKGSDKRWRFEIIETEAKVVRLIFQWYIFGDTPGRPLSLNQITDKLNALGIKPKRAKKWGLFLVSFLVRNETYCGRWYYSGRDKGKPTAESIPVPVPAIITRKLWEIAQERLEENKVMSSRNRTPGRYLLSNRLTCGACGYKMHGTTHYTKIAGKSYRYFYYICPNLSLPKRKKYCMCDNPVLCQVDCVYKNYFVGVFLAAK